MRGVKGIAGTSKRDITRDEFLIMAKQYSRARDELEKTFFALPEEQPKNGPEQPKERARAAPEQENSQVVIAF